MITAFDVLVWSWVLIQIPFAVWVFRAQPPAAIRRKCPFSTRYISACRAPPRRAPRATLARMPHVGAPIKRPDDPRLLTGRGRYVDDLTLPRMVHVAFVRSPHAHATIAGLDV